MYPENIMSISQKFQSNEIINIFSTTLGEGREKTGQALRSVIPTIIRGIISKSQSALGPDSLVNLVNKDGLEMSQVKNLQNEHVEVMGSDAVSGLFGNDLSSVAQTISREVKLDPRTILKLMSLAAPFVMGLIGAKMRGEGLSTAGLMGFLGQQKESLGMVVSDATEASEPTNPLWLTLILVALMIASLVWWSSGMS